jgi:hypothetical protein
MLTCGLPERAASTTYSVNDMAFEAGFPHFVLGVAHRWRFQAMLARESGPSLVTFPWWRAADADRLAELAVGAALARMGRGELTPTFQLAWGDATTLGGDGAVRDGASTIGHATVDERIRIARALANAGFVRSGDDSLLLETCEVRIGGHAVLVDLDASAGPASRVSEMLATLRAEAFGAPRARGEGLPASAGQSSIAAG